MMGGARLALPRIPGIEFWKLCGSGTGDGFTPVPNTAVYAILAAWPDLGTARTRTGHHRLYRWYQRWSSEHWTVFLSAISSRGAWAGTEPFEIHKIDQSAGPIAILTRATVKPSIVVQFWNRVPGISAVISADPNVLFKIGIGEVPLLHQVTFSIWPDVTTMAAFARDPVGPHARAITAVRNGQWFKEELYARFAILGDSGSWGGGSPLAPKEPQR